MKERPILFSGAVVRAILEGRKTQTRRVVKIAELHADFGQPDVNGAWIDDSYMAPEYGNVPCLKVPFGPEEDRTVHRHFPRWDCGDRLWVKETFSRIHPGMLQSLDPDVDSPFWETVYRADELGGYVGRYKDRGCLKWRPSIFMPRKLSRITLEISRVRVERLKEISEADAKAEGAGKCFMDRTHPDCAPGKLHTYREDFRLIWKAINGPESWELNPWVWVVEFRRVEKGGTIT